MHAQHCIAPQHGPAPLLPGDSATTALRPPRAPALAKPVAALRLRHLRSGDMCSTAQHSACNSYSKAQPRVRLQCDMPSSRTEALCRAVNRSRGALSSALPEPLRPELERCGKSPLPSGQQPKRCVPAETN